MKKLKVLLPLLAIFIGPVAHALPASTATAYYFTDGDFGPYYSQESATGAPVSASAARNDGGIQTSATASADLSTGSLKAFTSMRSTSPQSNELDGTSAIASFSDTLTHFNSGSTTPFVWTSATTASFTINLSGSTTNLVGTNPVANSSELRSGGRLILSIYAHGSSTVLKDFAWGLSPDDTTFLSFEGGGFEIVPVDDIFSSFPQSISVSFNPGGDFDWSLWMAVGSEGTNTPGNRYTEADFSHTAKISYTAPEGSDFVSASGLFQLPPTSVPEPGALVLLCLGMFAIAVSRQLNKSTIREPHGF